MGYELQQRSLTGRGFREAPLPGAELLAYHKSVDRNWRGPWQHLLQRTNGAVAVRTRCIL
eukprot:365950-Chlamydomonas_euryale.AAC.6